MIFNELNFIEKIYVVTSIITSIGSFFLGFFVYRKNSKRLVNVTYLLMSLSVAIWSFALFLCHTSADINAALFYNKIVHLGTVFIPITFFHFIIELLGIVSSKIRVLQFGYVCAFMLIAFLPLDLFVLKLQAKFDFRLWPVPGPVYPLFLLFFSFYSTYALWLVFDKYRKSKGIRREQLKFIFLGVSIAFIGGSTNYAYFYNIPIPPIGNFFVFSYVIFLAYSIVKYRLMDITVAFTRVGIFITVYSLVLGLPIWIGFRLLGNGVWLLPAALMGVFATAGPFIYLYIQKRAEDALMAEQKRYQTTLRQASAGMGRIKDLKKLLNMIVYVLTRAVRLEHALIYIYEERKKYYGLGASKCRVGYSHFSDAIDNNAALIRYLIKNRAPIIHEEIKQRIQDFQDFELVELEGNMVSLEAELIIPIFVDQDLIAFVGMGKKESGKLYNEDDLSVFTILANQAALAIENAQFYEDMKKTQEQLFQAEKMATIGTMADGLSHQINNRFHALGFIAGDALDTIKIIKEKGVPDGLTETFVDLERAFNRVQDNVVQGGEVVQGLLRYTRKGDAGFTAVNFDDVFKSAFEMAQFKIKTSELKVVRMYDSAVIPKIKGNFTQLQEVFFNLIDNGYDAMMQRKIELKEAGFQPTLKVYVNPLEGNQVELIFEDNGAGVKPDDMNKLFTPFFTTKLSSKKGTGLGLYVIKKIIEDNHKGQVIMDSVYMVGTKMKLRLPIAFE